MLHSSLFTSVYDGCKQCPEAPQVYGRNIGVQVLLMVVRDLAFISHVHLCPPSRQEQKMFANVYCSHEPSNAILVPIGTSISQYVCGSEQRQQECILAHREWLEVPLGHVS